MNFLVKAIGFPATLIHGDTLVLDRWRWLKRRLHRRSGRLLDVGCGSGAFSIGAARMGYATLGLSWDQRNQQVAAERAALCKASGACFEVQDVRRLGDRSDLFESFDIAICLETIEHILDDQKLVNDIAACLKVGGTLLLTTPSKDYRAIGPNPDDGPFSSIEDGGHVRKGYLAPELHALCNNAGLRVDAISYCSGFLSQKVTYMLRMLEQLHPLLGWTGILPLRLLPIADPVISPLFKWPDYSICLEAHKASANFE